MSTSENNKTPRVHIALLSLMLLLLAVVYGRGLNSGFLFDDQVNLEGLANVEGGIFDRSFWDFVLGGTAGPLGRPLSLLSFALQAAAWPEDPFAFKLVNLLIHAVNTVLVYALCVQFVRIQKPGNTQTLLIASLCTALWALHPLHLTAVIYNVQRMTLLCSSFMLAGLLCYLHYRPRVATADSWKALLPLTLALGSAALLALLAKENAASLLLYVIALELTIFSGSAVSVVFKRWRTLVLWVPLLLLAVSTLVYVSISAAGFSSKLGFGRLDRVLTESRILWTYLAQAFSPDLLSTELFHTPQLSTSLLAPLTTLFSCLAWLAALALAGIYRRKQPLIALAVLWFLAGHVIEGSVIPLELYFNHRNYLAIIVPLLAFIQVLMTLREKMPGSAKPLLLAVPVLMAAVFAWQTAYHASRWHDPLRLAVDWYSHDRLEVRNAEFYAIKVARTGEAGAQAASDVYDDILQNNPTLLRPLFNRILLTCLSSANSLPAADVVSVHIEQGDGGETDLLTPLNELVDQSLSGKCAAVRPDYVEWLLQRLVPRLSQFNQPTALFALGKIRQQAGDSTAALALYDQAFAISHDAGILFAKAILQMNSADAKAALTTIEKATALVLDHNDIQTGSQQQKLQVLGQMQRDAQAMLNAPAQTSTP